MNIRSRITLRFIFIVAIIISVASLLIYILSADYRRDEYYKRLYNKANSTAKLLIEVDEVDADLLKRIEKDNPTNLENEKIIIHDFKNSPLFSTDEKRIIEIDSSLLSRIRLEGDIRYRQGDYEVLGFLFKGRYDRFVVIAAATDIYGFNKLRNLRNVLTLVFFISIAVVSVSGWFFAGKALHPITEVVHRVDEISISSLDLRLHEGNGRDEIARLSRTFNRMLGRLETSFNMQKDFISNASHEFRTPLTIIRGQLEVTLLSTRSQEDYQNVLLSILEDIKSLNNLSNQLLLLAQTTAEGFAQKMDPLRIDEVAWQVRDDLMRHNPSFKINIDFDNSVDDDQELIIPADEQLIKVAVANIMENGCKYSADHTVHVLIASSPFGLTLKFTDHGIGIPEEDQHKIFEPFHRGSNTQNVKGHGIGLSMVKHIIKLHYGTIQVDSLPGSGTTVLIHLPFRKLLIGF
jgi:signal transduction histidine kinase